MCAAAFDGDFNTLLSSRLGQAKLLSQQASDPMLRSLHVGDALCDQALGITVHAFDRSGQMLPVVAHQTLKQAKVERHVSMMRVVR